MVSRNCPQALVVVLTSLVVCLAAAAEAQTVVKKLGPVDWVGDLAPISPDDWSYDRAAHLLERAGFGGTPEEIQRLASMTPAEAVDYLVDYERRDNGHLQPFEESGIYGVYGPVIVESTQPALDSNGTTTLAGRVEVADGGVGGVPLRDHEIYLDIPGQEQRVALSDHYGRFRFHSVPLGTVAVHARGKHPGKTQNTSNIQHVTLTEPNDFVYVPLLLFPTPDNDDGSKHPDVYGVVNELRARHIAEAVHSRRPDLLETHRLEQWWAERMLRTNRPLEEKLLFFWHGHFATSADKVADYRLILQQLETMRLHASGNFAELLTAVSKTPAMLIYLDGNQNVKGQFNENFAREIMELFALGLDQYTEEDIKEAARAFSGWTNAGPTFVFTKDGHDPSEKHVFGQAGHYDGDDIIALILEHPSCARFIVRKLHKFFVRGDMTPDLEDRMAALLRDNAYQLKPLLRTMFLSRDFYSQASMGEAIKSPVAFVVSTYRKLGLETLPTIPDFRESTTALGQELFFPPNVSGWNGDKDGGTAWINPGMFLNRANFIHSVLFPEPVKAFWPPDRTMPNLYVGGSEYTEVRAEYDYAFTRVNRIVRSPAPINLIEMLTQANAKTADEAVEHLVRRFLPSVGLDPGDRQRLVEFLTSENGGNMLDFNAGEALEQTLRQVVHLILSMPEYNVG